MYPGQHHRSPFVGRISGSPQRRPVRWSVALLAPVVAAVALAVFVSPLSASADGWWEGAVEISDGQSEYWRPRVAVIAGPPGYAVGPEYVHVVWQRQDSIGVIYRRSPDGGNVWGAIQYLVGGVSGTRTGPHIASQGNTVHIVWRAENGRIMYLRNNGFGAPGGWDPAVELSDSNEGTRGYSPDVAAYGDHVYVVWVMNREPQHQPDIVVRASHDNGLTWLPPFYLTMDGDTTEEDDPRVATYGENAYVTWVDPESVQYSRSIDLGVTWDTPRLTLWNTAFAWAPIAAYEWDVYVDCPDNAGGPGQKKSGNWGVTFPGAPTWLGSGADLVEVDASKAWKRYGASVYIDTRDSVDRLYVTTSTTGETPIDMLTGSAAVCNADIAAHRFGNMHVVVNSGYQQGEIYYYRYRAPRTFIPWPWWDDGNMQPAKGVAESDAKWGDLDGDDDLDLVYCGESSEGRITQVWMNDQSCAFCHGNRYLVYSQDLVGIQSTGSDSLDLGDYDGDGDLDLVMAGMSDSGRIARVYENEDVNSGYFVWDASQVLTGVSGSSVAWGDYDNDGDLDLYLQGHDGTNGVAVLYENDPLGTLAPDMGQSLTGLYNGSADWADWNGDGDFDLFVTGSDGTASRSIFYKNEPIGTLANDGAHGLPGATLSDAAWGDCDADGDLDLAWTGEAAVGGPRHARVYENDGTGVMTQVGPDLLPIYRSSCAWGDYDNDGDLDVAFCGYDGGYPGLYNHVYENTGGGFALAYTFDGVREGSLTWADVDEDGNLDYFVTGFNWSRNYADLHNNLGYPANTAPAAPTTLTCPFTPGKLHLQWMGASDSETATPGLYYCLQVGATSRGHEILSGTYGTPLMGNVDQNTDLILSVPSGTYYWSVQSIDSGFMVSAWPEEVVITFCVGDLDGDGDTDHSDLGILLADWGCTGGNCPGDLDGDGDTDHSDLGILLADWGCGT